MEKENQPNQDFQNQAGLDDIQRQVFSIHLTKKGFVQDQGR